MTVFAVILIIVHSFEELPLFTFDRILRYVRVLMPYQPIELVTLETITEQVDRGQHGPWRGAMRTITGEVAGYIKFVDERRLVTELCCSLIANGMNIPSPQPLLVMVSHEHFPNLSLTSDTIACGTREIGYPDFKSYINRSGPLTKPLRDWPSLAAAAAFDIWVGIEDRLPENLIYDGGNKFWLIDFDSAMPTYLQPGSQTKGELAKLAAEALSEIELHRLRNMMLRSIEGCPDINGIFHAFPIQHFQHCGEILSELIQFLLDRKAHMHKIITDNLGIKQLDLIQNETKPAASNKQ